MTWKRMQFARATEALRQATTYMFGEPVIPTDGPYKGRLFIGDGATLGGLLATASPSVLDFKAATDTTIAAAATTDLSASLTPRVVITGTTAITSFGNGQNELLFVRFRDAGLPLTAGANLIIPGVPAGQSRPTQAGDMAIVSSDGASPPVWRVRDYQTADGTPTTSLQGFRNRIINGSFRVNQRAYVSGTALAAGAYGHDRWKGGASGGGTYTFNQAVGDTQITITAGTLVQVIEGANLPDGGTYTLSWTGTSQARVNGGAYGTSPLLVTGLAAAANATIEFAAGTVGLVQFEVGAVATAFERRPLTVERMLCYPYYRTFDYRESPYFAAAAATTYQSVIFDLAPEMRGNPTITYFDDLGTAGSVNYVGGGGGSLSRGAAYATAASTKRVSITAYTPSRAAHGCSLRVEAEL